MRNNEDPVALAVPPSADFDPSSPLARGDVLDISESRNSEELLLLKIDAIASMSDLGLDKRCRDEKFLNEPENDECLMVACHTDEPQSKVAVNSSFTMSESDSFRSPDGKMSISVSPYVCSTTGSRCGSAAGQQLDSQISEVNFF